MRTTISRRAIISYRVKRRDGEVGNGIRELFVAVAVHLLRVSTGNCTRRWHPDGFILV